MNKLIPKHLSTSPITYNLTLPDVTVTAINLSHATNKKQKLYIDTINANRNIMMDKYNLSDKDYADISKFAVNVAERESSFGKDPIYRGIKALPDSVLLLGRTVRSGVRHALGRNLYDPNYLSRGMTYIKFGRDIADDSNLKDLYNYWGITEKKLDSDPKTMATATLVRAIHGKNKLGLDNKTYHWSDGTPISNEEALALWWNKGKLTDKANENPKSPNYNFDPTHLTATDYIRGYNKYKIIK